MDTPSRLFQCFQFYQPSSNVRATAPANAVPFNLDGVLLLLPTHSTFGPAHHSQLQRSSAGGPTWSLGFALTLHPIVKRIQEQVPGLTLNSWYLDDGTLVGFPDQLAAALNIIEQDGPALGLNLNRSKSLLFIPEEEDASLSPLPSDIPVTRQGFSLLGCPIGPPTFCEDVFLRRVSKIKASLDSLHDLEDSQIETSLLRSCLALPKVSYVLRACPPTHLLHAAEELDYSMRKTLEAIIGAPLTDWSWLKASLPSSLGGLNLRSAVLHAPAAFIASNSNSQPLIRRILGLSPPPSPHLNAAVTALAEAATRPNWTSLDVIDVPLRQKSLSHSIDEAIKQRLLSTAPTIRSHALSLSSGLPHAGDWLNVIPSPSLGLHLHDQEFRSCLRYWLGVPLHSSSYPCPECGRVADMFGDHQVGCGGNGDRIARHNAVRDVLFSAAQSAALAPIKEAPSLVPSSSSRPADILLPAWSHGRPAALDVHIISPLQLQTLVEAATHPGHALDVGVHRKLSSHLSVCRSAGVDFIPVVAETLGGLAKDTISMIRSIGRALGQRSNPSDPATSTQQLFGRFALALWRGNACSWLHRVPLIPPSLDGCI